VTRYRLAEHHHLTETERAVTESGSTRDRERASRIQGWGLVNLAANAAALGAFQQAKEVADSDPHDEVEAGADLLAGLALASQLTGQTAQAAAGYAALVAKAPEWADPETIANLRWSSTVKERLEALRAVTASGTGSVAREPASEGFGDRTNKRLPSCRPIFFSLGALNIRL